MTVSSNRVKSWDTAIPPTVIGILFKTYVESIIFVNMHKCGPGNGLQGLTIVTVNSPQLLNGGIPDQPLLLGSRVAFIDTGKTPACNELVVDTEKVIVPEPLSVAVYVAANTILGVTDVSTPTVNV